MAPSIVFLALAWAAVSAQDKSAGDSPATLLPSLASAPLETVDPTERQLRCARRLNVEAETVNSFGMKLVLIPPGEFTMGSSDRASHDSEGPEHKVRITRPLWMGAREVTQEEFLRLTGAMPSLFGPRTCGLGNTPPMTDENARSPVENVSWDAAQRFCQRLSELPDEKAAGRTYRLPTEAEWEYACRAGSSGPYGFGKTAAQLAEHAWYTKNAKEKTHPVGTKRPNPWRLYDMQGNVSEWCADWYNEKYYAVSPVNDPAGPATGTKRVYRGGCWCSSDSHCRASFRFFDAPREHDDTVGFRVVCAVYGR